MSSFIGHSIPAISFYFSGQWQRYSFFRLTWLVLVAWAPDIDYLIPALRPNGFRTTHSLFFCSILPCITIFILYFIQQKRGQELKFMGMQVILTAFSHLVLDLSVGVGALPLLYPFSSQRFKFPFGLLPSAGKIDLSNYFFLPEFIYRNGSSIALIFKFIFACSTGTNDPESKDINFFHGYIFSNLYGLGIFFIAIN